MSFLKNLWRDLVDKRLWPVALALLVAAVAVPVLIGSGGDAEPVAATPPPVETPTVGAQIAVATDGDDKPRSRAGSARDPFKALVYAKAEKAAAGTASTAAAGAASPPAPAGAPANSGATGSAKVGSGSGSGSSGPATTPSKAPTGSGSGDAKPSTPSVSPKIRYFNYTIGLQLKRAGRLTSRGKVRAVAYLPSAAYPLVSYLGVKTDGKTASFMVSPGVLVSGKDRVCRPSRDTCRILELEAGDNVLLAKTPPAGQPLKRHRLMITRVGLTRVLATAKAATARTTRGAAATKTRAVPVDLAPVRQVAAG